MQDHLSIVKATMEDLDQVTSLALALWPSHERSALRQEMAELLADREAAIFMLLAEGEAAAFAQAGLRYDYVEGTSTSPVGYLEGIYVRPNLRRQGAAKRLAAACEAWARQMGCVEMASDCSLENSDSQAFHTGAGFTEAGRIVCFLKKL